MRHTKIVATLGPACDNDRTLDELMLAGVDVVRLNFSHGTHDTHAASCARVRQAAQRAGRSVAILQDLSGPKIRTGRLAGGNAIPLTVGDPLRDRDGRFRGRPRPRVDDLRGARARRTSRTGPVARRRPRRVARGEHHGNRDRHDRAPRDVARRAQGHQRARRRAAGIGADTQGRRRSSIRPFARCRPRRFELRAERRRSRRRACGHGGSRRAGRSARSPSWNGRKRSRGSTKCSTAVRP